MGSEKYPSENGFDAFLKKHGGSDNASTDCERTIFQFDVQRKSFKEALDRQGSIRCFVLFPEQLLLRIWLLEEPSDDLQISTKYRNIKRGKLTKRKQERHVKTVITHQLQGALWKLCDT